MAAHSVIGQCTFYTIELLGPVSNELHIFFKRKFKLNLCLEICNDHDISLAQLSLWHNHCLIIYIDGCGLLVTVRCSHFVRLRGNTFVR